MALENKDYWMKTVSVLKHFNSYQFYELKDDSLKSNFIGLQLNALEQTSSGECSIKVHDSIKIPGPVMFMSKLVKLIKQSSVPCYPIAQFENAILLPGPKVTLQLPQGTYRFPKISINTVLEDRISMTPAPMQETIEVTGYVNPNLIMNKQIIAPFTAPNVCYDPANVNLSYSPPEEDRMSLVPSDFKRKNERRTVPYSVPNRSRIGSISSIISGNNDPLSSIINQTITPLINSQPVNPEYRNARYRIRLPSNPVFVPTSEFIKEADKYILNGRNNVLPLNNSQPGTLNAFGRSYKTGDLISGSNLEEYEDVLPYLIWSGIITQI